jgi:hypothetical protein
MADNQRGVSASPPPKDLRRRQTIAQPSACFGFEILFKRDILTLFQPICVVVFSRWRAIEEQHSA